jgi:hypothetical protein
MTGSTFGKKASAPINEVEQGQDQEQGQEQSCCIGDQEWEIYLTLEKLMLAVEIVEGALFRPN